MPTPNVLPHARVLLVDDHHDTREMFELRTCGAEVTVAGTVAAALDVLASHAFDVVVSGDLPDGSHPIVQHAREGNALTVALTGRCMPGEIEATRDVGFEVILLKPIDPEELCDAVAAALRQRRAA